MSSALPRQATSSGSTTFATWSTDSVIRQHWLRAIDHLLHDSESASGYGLPDRYVKETDDVVGDLFAGALDDDLRERVGLALDPDWWFKPGVLWLEDAELYLESWSGFRTLVSKTGVALEGLLDGSVDDRGWSHEATDGIRPSEILLRLVELFDELGVVQEIPTSTRWCRAVQAPVGTVLTASRLGTAPPEVSSENRMNRAGDPMFYGAIDASTATAEIGPPADGRATTVGTWVPSRPIRLLNLVDLGEPPDLYDVEHSGLRWRQLFLADFADDVSRPVDGEKAEHRATQLLMAFFMDRVERLDGIMYRSSLTTEPCCALKVDNSGCVDPGTSPATTGALQLILEKVETAAE